MLGDLHSSQHTVGAQEPVAKRVTVTGELALSQLSVDC